MYYDNYYNKKTIGKKKQKRIHIVSKQVIEIFIVISINFTLTIKIISN